VAEAEFTTLPSGATLVLPPESAAPPQPHSGVPV
jgi:hypothetical protein